MADQPIRVAIIVGEVSGDLLGAELIKSLQAIYPNLQFEGILGPALKVLGGKSLFPMERLSVMGFVEPLKRLPELLRMRKLLIEHFTSSPPDVFIGIDAPDFNLGLELALKKQGIKTVHYVSPSVWAWRKYRIKKIKRAVDLMLTLFPFEKQIYLDHQIAVDCVGHPFADAIDEEVNVKSARMAVGMLEANDKVVAVLPGSRVNEIKYMADDFIGAMKLCHQQQSELKFIVPFVSQELCDQFMARKHELAPDVSVLCTFGQARETIASADVVLCSAGTATLEAMLYKKPMVVAYKTAKFNYFIAKCLVRVKHIALPNLIFNKRIVPEFIQHEVTPETLSRGLLNYFDQPQLMARLKEQFRFMHRQLKCNAGKRAAEQISKLLVSKSGS